jgi:hypothetical protein
MATAQAGAGNAAAPPRFADPAWTHNPWLRRLIRAPSPAELGTTGLTPLAGPSGTDVYEN